MNSQQLILTCQITLNGRGELVKLSKLLKIIINEREDVVIKDFALNTIKKEKMLYDAEVISVLFNKETNKIVIRTSYR